MLVTSPCLLGIDPDLSHTRKKNANFCYEKSLRPLGHEGYDRAYGVRNNLGETNSLKW